MADAARYWAVVPAAGSGRRMGSDRPKQYLPVGNRTIIEHTLGRLRTHTRLSGVVVVIAPDDAYWPTITIPNGKGTLLVAHGGAERCHSVLNGLQRLREHSRDDDWVLVHDAARPLVTHTDIDALIAKLVDHPVGGLLAAPVADTMKRANADGAVVETVDRHGLWRALTPQMFRWHTLHAALGAAINAGALVTDEAQAIERAGLRPQLVEGRGDNIKVTRAEDLRLAEWLLQQQG